MHLGKLNSSAEKFCKGQVTARVWRALGRTRCEQLGLPADTEELTTCSRAVNFRRRAGLAAGYCANGVTQVWTDFSVRELVAGDDGAVAAKLRRSLQACRQCLARFCRIHLGPRVFGDPADTCGICRIPASEERRQAAPRAIGVSGDLLLGEPRLSSARLWPVSKARVRCRPKAH